jgi:phosphoribosyl-ATP pyrophosphohydrolase
MSLASPSPAVLEELAAVIESRKAARGGDPDTSYVARLLDRGPDGFLKKVGEEATEVVMAAKDLDHARSSGTGVAAQRALLVGEVADLWFHCLITLAYFELSPADVLAELQRRAGTSGIEEKALRKAASREQAERPLISGEKTHG